MRKNYLCLPESLFLLSIFFLTFVSFGQPKLDNYEIELGPFFKVSKRSVPTEFIGSDDSGFYLSYARGKTGFGELSLAKFGYNLELIRELELTQPLDGKAYSKTVFILNNRMFHFLQAETYGGNRIYLQEIDKQNLTFEEPRLIATITNSANTFSGLTVHISSDSSYIVLVYSVPSKGKEREELGIHVFNKKMEEVWNRRFELPYANKLLDLTTFRVDTHGDLHVLGKRFFDKRKNTVAGQINYDYLLFDLDRSGTIDSFKIETKEKYLKDMQVDIAPDGDIVCAGFYSEKNSVYVGGAFYLRIDGQSRETLSSSFKEFDSDFITQNMKEGKAKRMEKRIAKGKNVELPFYYIDEFLVDADGRTKIIAESRYIYTTSTYSQYGSSTSTHYDYDDMMVIDINPDGEINWATRVAKNQHTVNDGAVYSSYSTVKTSNDLFLIFNDNVANLNYNGTGRVETMTKGSSTMVMVNKIDASGNMKRSALFSRGEVGIKVRPALCKQISIDEMLLFGHKGLKTQRFILLKFK